MPRFRLVASIVLVFALLGSTNTRAGYHIISTYKIASAGGWDYIALCPVNDNIYVSHGTQVNILNKNTGDSVGVIPNTTGVHGIAFVPALNKGFTSNGKTNNVTVFDIKTNEVITNIATGENPDAIMFDRYSKMIVVCNGHSNDLSIIDPATNMMVQTIALGGKPETAVSDEEGKIFVNIEDKNELVVVDAKKWSVEQRYKTSKGEEPAGLAIDNKTKRLFIGCGNKLLVVMDATNGKIVKEISIGDGCDGVAFDNQNQTIYSSNGEGTLTVIKEKNATTFEVVENATTQQGARTLAEDEVTHRVYLPTAEFGAAVPGQRRRSMIPGTFRVLVMGE